MNAFFHKQTKQAFFSMSLFLFCLFTVIDFGLKKIILLSDIPHLCNPGIAMSITLPQPFFVIAWCSAIVLLALLWRKEPVKNLNHALPYILIFSGACGNIIDRVLYDCVIDYIPLLNISLFNLADFFITLGALLLIVNNRKQ